jgi:hypothetical protein
VLLRNATRADLSTQIEIWQKQAHELQEKVRRMKTARRVIASGT